MRNPITPWMLGASLLAATVISSAHATEKPARPSKTVSSISPVKKEPADAQTSKVPPTDEAKKKASSRVSIAGNYEASGSLLTVLRYTQGRENEYLVAYTRGATTAGQYCSFFSAPIVAPGETTFTAHRYAIAGLPSAASNCMMRIKADGIKAEIMDVTSECRQLCDDGQTYNNPGVLKRVPDQ
jgi:hypothetical protein